MNSPFLDQAKPLLAAEPTINDDQRADLWDIFHNSKDEGELASKLAPLAVPDDLKHQLFTAKQQAAPRVEPLDRATAAITRVASLNPNVLEVAESHPKVTAALVAAAEKGAETAQDESAPVGKGKTLGAGKQPAPLAQPPRPDGLPHMPPIPEGHHRILASDGGIHDIPAENIDQARQIDPLLHVLNP